MTGQGKEWIVFASFFGLLVVAVVCEIAWLARSGRTTSGKAVAFVLVTDLVGAVAGSMVSMSLALGMFMIVMGPAGTGSKGGEGWLWIGLVGLIILPPALLFVVKRVFLALFKIMQGREAWLYSLVASMLIFVITLVPPSLLAYFL